MKVADFDYHLPETLIAQNPAPRRDGSRLMVVDRLSGAIRHRVFRDLPDHLSPDDLLVLNDSRVFPARFRGRKHPSGAQVEVLLLHRGRNNVWETLIRPGRRIRPGTRLVFDESRLEAEVTERRSGPVWRIRFFPRDDLDARLEESGRIPLPPYIRRATGGSQTPDWDRYQTVYASRTGSVAAPTAGLHFTDELLRRIPHCMITLHVGYGTFQPVTCEKVERHTMEPEWFSVEEEPAGRITAHLEQGKRIVAVGTTSARVLESIALKQGRITPGQGETSLFIYPGFSFRVVGALLTNFHLPKSTLLMLVCAFAGRDLILESYREAIREGYRFYSYGDAMLIA